LYVDAHFTPSAIVMNETAINDIYIVVDVIRATTSMAVMFDQGAARVLAASSIEQAREGARLAPGRLLCGERNVQRIPGFDYGNSPTEFSRLDLLGRTAVIATSNGTRALHAVAQAPAVFVGCLLNRVAVCDAAIVAARRHDAGIAIVCAGNNYGATFSIDDAVTAGALSPYQTGASGTGSSKFWPT